MHRLAFPLLPLLFLCACGSSEYARTGAATVRQPPPSSTPTGTGLPTPGQPGRQQVPGIRPGPRNKRYLPPSERPGVYAADGDAQRALLLRIRRPVPGRVPPGTSKEAWTKCWADARDLLLSSPEVLALSEAELECLRKLLYADCSGWLLGRAAKAKQGEGTAADRVLFRTYFPTGALDENAWDDAINGRRDYRVCEGRGAYTERVVGLSRQLQGKGRDEMGWRLGVP